MRPVLVLVVTLVTLVAAWPGVDAQNATDIPRTRYIVHVQYEIEVVATFSASNSTYNSEKSFFQVYRLTGSWEATFKLVPFLESWSGEVLGGSREGRLFLSQRSEDKIYNETHDVVNSYTTSIVCERFMGIDETPFVTGQFDVVDGNVEGDLYPTGGFSSRDPCEMRTTDYNVRTGTRYGSGPAFMHGISITHAGLPKGPVDLTGAHNAWTKPGAFSFSGASGVRFVAPLNATTEFQTDASGSTPVVDGGLAEGQYCTGLGSSAWGEARGTCDWSGRMSVYVKPDPCEGLQEEYDARVGELKALGRVPPPGPDRGFRLANYGETVGYFIARINVAVRHAQLWGCDLKEDAYVQQVLLELRSAWEAYWRTTSDTHYAEDWTKVDRTCEQMGFGPSSGGPASAGAAGGGEGASQGVGVHSPVELEAFSRDGGRVGWDPATNNSTSTIPGASYQGRPGGPQSLTLPAGEFRIVLHELADSAMAITDDWSAPGAEGNDTALASATKGRTTSYYVTLAQDAGGNWSRSVSPALRQTTASFEPGFARPLASALPPDVPAPPRLGGSPSGDDPPDDPTIPSLGDIMRGRDGGGEASGGSSPESAPKGVPGALGALAVLALVGAALASRRR